MTYTISAYVRTTGMASSGNGLCLVVDSPGVSRFSERIKGNTNWRRVEMTFTTQSNVNQVKVFARLQTKGTAYVDCVQLEKQSTASRYNLIENGDFFYGGSTASAPYGWNPGNGAKTTLAENRKASGLDRNTYTISGDAQSTRRCQQNVSAQGSKGDVYSLGGWALGNVAPMTDSGRMFGIIGQFNNKDGTTTQVKVNFNPDLYANNIWQYACERMIAEKDYNSITVSLVFDKNVNQVWFDGIQLVKDEFGESYTYDSNGNVISVQDLSKKNATYEYANNDLTKEVFPGGATLSYKYDAYHNVSEASSGMGIKESGLGTDAFGNNTSVKTLNSSDPSGAVIQTEAKYSSDGNYITQIVDANRWTAAYTYDENTGNLSSIRNPLDTFTTRTKYSYDSMDRVVQISKMVNDMEGGPFNATVKYTYDGDRLKSVSHSNDNANETKYTFSYGSFDLLTQVMVGNRVLLTNSYDTAGKTFNKTKTDYKNGNSVAYTYDQNGRKTSIIYDGNSSHKIEYVYDSGVTYRNCNR